MDLSSNLSGRLFYLISNSFCLLNDFKIKKLNVAIKNNKNKIEENRQIKKINDVSQARF